MGLYSHDKRKEIPIYTNGIKIIIEWYICMSDGDCIGFVHLFLINHNGYVMQAIKATLNEFIFILPAIIIYRVYYILPTTSQE